MFTTDVIDMVPLLRHFTDHDKYRSMYQGDLLPGKKFFLLPIGDHFILETLIKPPKEKFFGLEMRFTRPIIASGYASYYLLSDPTSVFRMPINAFLNRYRMAEPAPWRTCICVVKK